MSTYRAELTQSSRWRGGVYPDLRRACTRDVQVGPYIGIDMYYIYGRADVDFLGLFLFVLVLTTCNDVFLAVRIVLRCL